MHNDVTSVNASTKFRVYLAIAAEEVGKIVIFTSWLVKAIMIMGRHKLLHKFISILRIVQSLFFQVLT
jgi:hypothetical protein